MPIILLIGLIILVLMIFIKKNGKGKKLSEILSLQDRVFTECEKCVRKSWQLWNDCSLNNPAITTMSELQDCIDYGDQQRDYCDSIEGCDFCAVEERLNNELLLFEGQDQVYRKSERSSSRNSC